MEMEYDSPEEAMLDHERLLRLYQPGDGLDARTWKKVRETMLNTGQCDPNLMEEMSKAQRFWINETKLALRAISNNQDESD